jgi:hypothetical protein
MRLVVVLVVLPEMDVNVERVRSQPVAQIVGRLTRVTTTAFSDMTACGERRVEAVRREVRSRYFGRAASHRGCVAGVAV